MIIPVDMLADLLDWYFRPTTLAGMISDLNGALEPRELDRSVETRPDISLSPDQLFLLKTAAEMALVRNIGEAAAQAFIKDAS
jgi:hypothetical protein